MVEEAARLAPLRTATIEYVGGATRTYRCRRVGKVVYLSVPLSEEPRAFSIVTGLPRRRLALAGWRLREQDRVALLEEYRRER